MRTSTSDSNAAMLRGDKVTLRPWRDDDVPFFVELRNDVQTQTALLAAPRPNTPDRVADWLNRRSDADDAAFFVIADNAGDTACGFIELREIDTLNRNGYLGIALAESVRGQGFAVEAMTLLEDYARSIFNLHKICLHVLAANGPDVKLYERCGYETAGVMREHFYRKGAYHDVAIMEKRIA